MDGFTEEWVDPFYMEILHGNYLVLEEPERSRFIQEAAHALATITEDVVERLLSSSDWRDQITGSWFCGLKNWMRFADPIGKSFVASTRCYAGQGYAFALACFGDEVSVRYLQEYLNYFLNVPEALDYQNFYDQNWAMPALMWIDAQQHTTYAEPYLVRGGLWQQFTTKKKSTGDLKASKQEFWQLMAFCQQHLSQYST